MKQEYIVLASLEDLPFIDEMYKACKTELLNQKIFQWDDRYPNIDFFKAAIHSNEMYVLKNGDKILGAFVIDEYQAPEWENINWSTSNGNYLILHSFCVHPSAEGRGYGGKLLQFTEAFAKENGYTGIRLDAFSENERALTFYEDRDYSKRGETAFSSKPINHQIYYCYEKII